MNPVVRYAACGYQQIPVLTASTGLTVPTTLGAAPVSPTIAIIIPEGQPVRFRDDGVAPTATVGMLIAVGQEFQYAGPLANIRFIETTASAKLNVSYYTNAG